LTGVVGTNNHLSGFGYITDSAGSLMAAGVPSLTYDA